MAQPTLKQKKFIHEYLKTGNITKSILHNYDINKNRYGNNKNQNKSKKEIDSQAYKIGYTNLKSPIVQSYISQILDSVGLSDINLSQSLQKIIQSSLTKRSLKQAQPSDGLRGIEMAFRLKDKFPAERKTISKLEVRAQLESKSNQELQDILNKTLEEANKLKTMLQQDKQQAQEGQEA